MVGLLPCSDFEMSPLAPEIYSCRGFDHIRNIGAADSSSNLNEIKASVSVGFQKLGMSDATNEAKADGKFLVKVLQR